MPNKESYSTFILSSTSRTNSLNLFFFYPDLFLHSFAPSLTPLIHPTSLHHYLTQVFLLFSPTLIHISPISLPIISPQSFPILSFHILLPLLLLRSPTPLSHSSLFHSSYLDYSFIPLFQPNFHPSFSHLLPNPSLSPPY